MFFSQVGSRDFFHPVVFIRRENTIGLTVLGQDFTSLKHHMVFEADKRGAKVGKRTFDCCVSLQCIGFIIMVGKDRLNTQLCDQLLQTGRWLSVAHQKPCLFVA